MQPGRVWESDTEVPSPAPPARLKMSPMVRTTCTDDELVRALRAGEAGAFDAIHHRYQAPLLAFARQLLGGRHHDAEEVVQDAFVRALGALCETDREMALRPWLYAITRNRALDELRKPQRTVGLPADDLGTPDPGGSPISVLARREAVERLVADLADLPSRQRRALVMHELEDRSHSQIGRFLNVSRGASKALVHRARGSLQARREG
jgi:RNA polymerase sigma-70 factor (ECF subfamily)